MFPVDISAGKGHSNRRNVVSEAENTCIEYREMAFYRTHHRFPLCDVDVNLVVDDLVTGGARGAAVLF